MAYTDIDKPSDYFNTITYTGDGNTRSLTGVGFQPDWVWVKERNGTNSHNLWDIVRGATKGIFSDQTTAELTNAASGYLTSFDSDGFSVQAGAGSIDNLNRSSGTYVAWNWYTGATASSNTDGSITSSVSVSTDAGFSIVSYTGTGSAATIGTGLNAVPKIVITRNRDSATNWCVYSSEVGNTKALFLNLNNAPDTSTQYWNDTTPTSSVFSVGTNTGTNKSGDGFVAYCFAEKQGYSKFGSYTGNGNTDGTFVYLGFRPAWVMRKVATGGTGGWAIYDNKREPENVMDKELFADTSSAEGSFTQMDFLSNGFKFRTSNSAGNGSGQTYIYMAFAESPFVNSAGVPNNAR